MDGVTKPRTDMDINSIISDTSRVNNQNSKPGSSELGQQQFLQLLVAQLQNQDPINPMDGAEFAAQLAQFNSVEQLVNVNSGLAALSKSQENMAVGLTNTMAASLTGKTVKAVTDEIHSDGSGTDINFFLKNSASNVDITIKDADGNVVRNVALTNFDRGDNSWTWDGRNNNGSSLPEGKFTVEINARSGDASVGSYSFLNGSADKVRYSSSGVELLVNGVFVNLGDIEEIGDGPQDQSTSKILNALKSNN